MSHRRDSTEKYDNGDVTVLDGEKGQYGNNHGHVASKDETVTRVLEANGYRRRQSSVGAYGRRKSSYGIIAPEGRRMSLHPTAGMTDIEKVEFIAEVTEDGEEKFHKMSWIQLVVVLIVTAVALGTLSMPV